MTDLLRGATRVEQVRYQYPSAADIAVESLSWVIEAGSFIVVTGESGSGKSTQLRLLNGLVPHFSGGRFAGQVLVGGQDTRFVPTRNLGAEIGFVFQEPDGLSIGGRVDDEIAFGLEQLGTPVAAMRRSVEESMSLLGVEHLRSRDVATLSGGERQRVAIAAAMAMHPAMLVLDEPTSQLDPAGAEDLIRAIHQLNDEHGVTTVLAEHRLERLLPLADQLRVLIAGGSPIEGTPRTVLAGAGSAFAPSLFKLGQHLGWRPLPLSVKEGRALHARSTSPLLPVREQSTGGTGEIMLTLSGVELRHDERTVLREIDFTVRQGEIVAVMGPNGSGKTTLLRSMAGLHPAARGTIVLQSMPVARLEKSAIGRAIGYLPQRARAVLFSETVQAEVQFSIDHRHGPPASAFDLMEEFDLLGYARRHPLDLSVGEQERLALAATLAGDPAVLLLDEPTRGLDRPRKTRQAVSLRERAGQGQAIVLATHDVEFAASLANRVLLLGGGELIADGTPGEVLDGSLLYGTQINKVFGQGFLTLEDVLASLQFGDTSGMPE